jgi:CheY-like chemotaxis protein
MPGEDGYSLIAQVRALTGPQGGGTPAIALTAYATADDQLRILAAGFQLHFPKPIQSAELLQAIARVVEETEPLPLMSQLSQEHAG